MDREPIAIIGTGCRFTKATDRKAFWELLQDNVDAITEVPALSWDIESLDNYEAAMSDQIKTLWRGFLEDVDQIDPQFFKISPREAMSIDPQQQILLEVTWKALEDTG
ncbi:hypothetical protein JYQ62_16365 [Nostoc sp. UHCC 0702]|nr:hypothetical protein JYQ62_16365 [Nostoc sp. UHCC 0702]